jgi:F-type H+-transporting ATPase subunit b
LISINFTLFVQILNFLVLVWLFNRLFIRPILANVEAKKQDLVQRQDAVAHLKDEASDRESAYQEKLKRVRLAAAEKRDAMLGEAKAEAEKLRRKASQEASEVMSRVRMEIGASVEETRRALREKEETMAAQLTEAVLGRKA